MTSYENQIYVDEEPENLNQVDDNVDKKDVDTETITDNGSQIKRGRGRPRKYPLQIRKF